MSYADSLRQQAKWIKEALDPATPESQRIELGDVDVDGLEDAATEIERLLAALLTAKAEVEWWLWEHRCCAGHETDAMNVINAALNNQQLAGKS